MSSDDENSQSGEAAAGAAAADAAATTDTETAGGEESKKTSSNPDDPFDIMGGLDFEEVRKRQEKALEEQRAKEAEKAANDDNGDIQVIKIGSLFDDDPLPISKPDPPKKTKSTDSSSPPRSGSGLGVERTNSYDSYSEAQQLQDEEDEEERRLEELAAQRRRERDRNTIKVGEKTLTRWPYDHYHMVQEEYWKRYFEREEQARLKKLQQAEDSDSSTSVSISSSDEDDDDLSSSSDSDDSSSSEESSSSESSRSEDSEERMERKRLARRAKKRAERRQRKIEEKKRLKRLNRDTEKEQEKRRKLRQKAMEEERQSGLHDRKSDILVFERPQDPPDIKQAVANLPLTEFESVAKERAIAKISTWLFDAGLVQELMATKKMSKDGKDGDEEEYNADGTKKKQKKVKIELTKNKDSKKEKDKAVDQGPRKTKMDIEIAKLEKTVRIQLEVITIRLNKGVATSGNEVQELVNSVVNTKGALVRLRQTSSMINDAKGSGGVAGMAANQTTFAINKYPHLKYAINARRNLQKCFRELTFFSQIPENCARLSDMLNTAEWSEHEWTTLRTVCREHVQLEIFLVEAEAGMKKQQQEEEDAEEDDDDPKKRRRSSMGAGISRKAFDVGLPHNNDEVDRFLKEHVQTVWDLGNEIRLKIYSGIANAFDLAFESPASMVALVEAVEIYESANRDYQSVHGGDGEKGAAKSLRFTDMRAVALGELYKDMEARGTEVFENLAASVDENDEDYQNKLFSAILRGANELSSEISFVAEQMAPCFPAYWAIEIIWTTCVAHLCASQILTQIGGPKGENLSYFGMPQLLDLVAWVENFRDIIEESFPEIVGLVSSERTFFDHRPTLLTEDNRTVDISRARDSLAFVNNTLWDAHDAGKVDFIFRTKELAEKLLDRFYKADHDKRQTSDGLLTTSLCGDIYGFIGLQLKTLRERLTRKSEAMIQLVAVIFKALYDAQKASRDHFLGDWECCCAGANDFIQMSEKCEDIISEIRIECQLTPRASEALDNQSGALLGLYYADALYAAQKISYFIFQDIYDSEEITPLFFTVEWLDEMPDNDLAEQIVITMDDYMTDLQEYLDDIMIQKAIEALIGKCVCYYIELLLKAASAHKSSRDSHFADNKRALERMNGDMGIIREFFQELAGEENRPLRDAIEREFDFF